MSIEIESRECDYCGKQFQPKRAQDLRQKFCCDNHRKDFFRYGAKMRIVAAVSRVFDKQLRVLEKRIAALENKSRKTLDAKPETVVTLQQDRMQ